MKNIPKWFDKNLLYDTDVLFKQYWKHQQGEGTNRRLFFDNKSDVLIVCHADTVQKPRYHGMLDFGYEKRIYASGLDDRLGLMIAFQMKNKFDILVCDLEESAESTAQYHNLKGYNWIVELDRAGTDYVHYNLASDEFLNDIENTIDIEYGYGSFSDISFMKTDICRFNLGTGYYDAHNIESYCIVQEVELTIERLNTLYKNLHSKRYRLKEMNRPFYEQQVSTTTSNYKPYSCNF
jgi:hypothetical protein